MAEKTENIVPDKLTDEQLERLIVAVEYLAKDNTIAQVALAALRKQGGKSGERIVILRTFAQTYALLLVMNMAVQSQVPAAQFKAELDKKAGK